MIERHFRPSKASPLRRVSVSSHDEIFCIQWEDSHEDVIVAHWTQAMRREVSRNHLAMLFAIVLPMRVIVLNLLGGHICYAQHRMPMVCLQVAAHSACWSGRGVACTFW